MRKIYDCAQIQKIYEPAATLGDELHLLKMGLIVTHRCTLRCKLCAERTPYYKNQYHPSLDYLKQEAEHYFQVVDYTMKLEITGGEPTLRTDLPELLDFLWNYHEQFGRIRIITNGTVRVGENLCRVLADYGKQADVLIDCYSNGERLLSVHAAENASIFRAHGINCILREQSEQDLHCGGWVDFGDFRVPRSEEKTKENLQTCAIRHVIGGCFRIREGIITPCAVTNQLADFGILALNEKEYLNLFDSDMDIRQKKTKLYQMFELPELSSCRYCDGMSDASERFAPAEQLVK